MNTLSYERSMMGRWAGAVLQDTYRVGRQIGRGGMGEVYEAGHARLPGRFAVKILHPELSASPEAFARFSREAEIMSALRHPHIVQIFDFNTTPNGLPYFVMEYLEGEDLEARLARGGMMPLGAVSTIVEAIASALGAAHANGIVHRDLKPSNIFLTRFEGQHEDFVKVLDFGISKVRTGARLSRGGEVFGTPQFMAPEQALGRLDQIDARTDQFALASMAYEMLTGQNAFVGDDASTLLYQVVHEAPRPLASFLGGDTSHLQAVLDRAMAKEQPERFPSMAEFARAFAAATEATLCLPAASTTPPPARILRTVAPAAPAAQAVDEPPPVQEAPALRVVPAVIIDGEGPAASIDPPAIDDWDLPSNIDRVPVTMHRAAALALVALGLAAFMIGSGWSRELPAALAFARENGGMLLHRPVPLPQPMAPQQAEPAPPAPSTGEAAPADEPMPAAADSAQEAAPVAPAVEAEPAPAPTVDRQATTAARAHAPASARHHRRARSGWTPGPTIELSPGASAARVSAPPSPGPLPALGGFTIAPPATQPPPTADIAPAPAPPAPRRGAAPPPSGDDPLPPSTP